MVTHAPTIRFDRSDEDEGAPAAAEASESKGQAEDFPAVKACLEEIKAIKVRFVCFFVL